LKRFLQGRMKKWLPPEGTKARTIYYLGDRVVGPFG